MRTGNYENEEEIRTLAMAYKFKNTDIIDFEEFKRIMLENEASPDRNKVLTPHPNKMSFSEHMKRILHKESVNSRKGSVTKEEIENIS